MEAKTFSTTLVLDWKTGKFKVIKRPPKSFKPNEIPIDFSLKIHIPDPLRVQAKGEVTLSEQKVSEIVANEI